MTRFRTVALALVALVLMGVDQGACGGTGSAGMGQVGAIVGIAAKEKATTGGTADFTLGGGTTSGFNTLVVAANRRFGGAGSWLILYRAVNGSQSEWGLGTLVNGNPDTLSRDYIKGSSNAGAKEAFSAPPEVMMFVPPDAYEFRGALVKKTSAQTIADNVIGGVAVDWDEEAYDTDGIWDPASPTVFAPPDDVQLVELRTSILWQSSASSGIKEVKHDSSPFVIGMGRDVQEQSGSVQQQIVSAILPHTPGRTYSTEVFQNTGAALDLPSSSETWFMIRVIQ